MRLYYTSPFPFLVFLCFFFAACQEEQAPSKNTDNQITASEPLPRLFLQTQTRRLRIRQTPDLEGAVLTILTKDLIVEYLHDSTSFTTEITYNRKDYNTSWYKVQAPDKTTGWVYAAFVQFLPPEENQKIVIQRETAELLEAANEKRPASTIEQKKEQKQVVQQQVVDNYAAYLKNLDKNSPSAISMAIQKYNALFPQRTNAKTNDAAYVQFHQFYHRVLQVLQRKDLSAYQHLAEEIQRYKRATMQQDDFTKNLANNGFNFALNKGRVVLAEDVDFLYRVFYRECSIAMRAYMNQYQLEEPNFWLDNEYLLIAPKQLARWILAWNYFVATYPDFVWHTDAKQRLEKQLNILLDGTNKTPVFNPKDATLDPKYQDAYQYIAKRYPESKIGQAFHDYLVVLEDNSWQRSSEVTQQQNKIMRLLVL